MLPTIPVPPKSLDDYVEDAGDEAVARLRAAAEPLEGSRLLHLNSTAYGGGVAELLLSHVGLLNDLGIQTTWSVVEGSEEFFGVTKAVHNGLQGAEVPWTAEMSEIYWERIRANAGDLDERFDFYMIHDPQPAGLLRIVDEEGEREGGWTWRCHIDLSAPFPPVWAFFEPMVNRYDAAIFTVEQFSQPGIQGPHVAFIPPSIDPTSTKNGEVAHEDVERILHAYGIDPSRPIVSQVSRFDPWKDPLGVIDAYRMAKEKVPDLQLIMAGSMADDDPEGQSYLELTETHRDDDPDIHLLTNFQHVGNTEINAFQQASAVVIQKSTREGFGLVIAEGMWKRKPVIGGNVGGIRIQIEDGVTGYLVDSVEACAVRMAELLADDELRARMGEAARARVRECFLTTRELEDTLHLLAGLR